jgi:hypothetical protein
MMYYLQFTNYRQFNFKTTKMALIETIKVDFGPVPTYHQVVFILFSILIFIFFTSQFVLDFNMIISIATVHYKVGRVYLYTYLPLAV